MTNRQWLAGLSDEALLRQIRLANHCPPGEGDYEDCYKQGGCDQCWLDWLRAESDKPTTSIYDIVEEHKNCTVQVLKNSITGEISVGWKEDK